MTLEELIEKTYSLQADMINGSEKDDETVPCFVGESSDGEFFVYATPFRGQQSKLMIIYFLKEKFKEKNIIRYAMASEAWLSTRKEGDPNINVPPSEDPLREEVLIVGGADINGKKLVKRATIIVADDNKRHIDPFEDSVTYDSYGGMMLSILDGE
jgi:hypothetical protein